MQDLETIKIDFNGLKENKLDESWLITFGWAIKKILKAVFGNVALPVEVRGSQGDVRSFLQTLSAEKGYIQALKAHGLDNPQTYRNKANLNKAVGSFERNTGLQWPFK